MLMLLLAVRGVESIEFWFGTKMEQQSHFQGRCSELVEKLSRRPSAKLVGRFDFDDQLLVDSHVNSIAAQVFAIVVNPDQDLARNAQRDA